MKRFSILLAVIALASLASFAIAGEGHEACTADTQACLDKYVAKLAQSGWLGIEGEYNEESGNYTVTSVAAESPAAMAGLQVEDVLFAFNGTKFADMSEEDWAKSASVRVPGAEVEYGFKRAGYKKSVTVTLAKMPSEIIAKKIGGHMVEHVTVAVQ